MWLCRLDSYAEVSRCWVLGVGTMADEAGKSFSPNGVTNFRDLRVWQAAMGLVTAVYQLTQTFPREETYGLAGQMRRAAVSVPSNIAEGHAREHLREYLHHLSIAQGSLAEL